MDIITRAAAGLPSPSVLTRRTTPWAGITWHHTGGNVTTWKAIHDWQTDGRPEASELIYIGYSYGIGIDGRVTELRGWDYRAAGDHDNSRLQVVFMGNWATKLPPVAALNAALEFARWAQAKAGTKLPGVAHRDVWPAGHRYDTDCPGNALYAWVRANLYTIGDDDMNPWIQHVMNYRLEAIIALRDVVKVPAVTLGGKAYAAFSEPNVHALTLKAQNNPDVDETKLADLLKPFVRDTLADLLDDVEPSDGPTEDEIRAIIDDALNRSRITVVPAGS